MKAVNFFNGFALQHFIYNIYFFWCNLFISPWLYRVIPIFCIVSSFYFHDSTKSVIQGCIEVESCFFEVLKEYRVKMRNKGIRDIKIKVMVRYPSDEHITSYIKSGL